MQVPAHVERKQQTIILVEHHLRITLIFPVLSCEVLSSFALHDIARPCPWSCWLITKNHQTLQWHPLGKGCLLAWNANLGEGLGCSVFSDILGCLAPLPGAASVGRGLTLTNKMLPPHQQACCCCCFQSSKGRLLHMLPSHCPSTVLNEWTSDWEEQGLVGFEKAGIQPRQATEKAKCYLIRN